MAWHPDIPLEYRDQIVTGDARELAKALPDCSIDLIFTDPPYPREYLPLYGWLAETAARVLKPGGSLVTLAGHAYLPDVMALMTPHLVYHWALCQYQPTVTNTATFWPRMVYIRWKPLLWFVKGAYTHRFIIQDGISPAARDKKHHAWGQPEDSASYWLYEMTSRLDSPIILDPFVGGGTTAAVCKTLGRSFVAFEIDEPSAARARERVSLTQAMHPVLLGEQAEMEL